jgi:hypothetical protein
MQKLSSLLTFGEKEKDMQILNSWLLSKKEEMKKFINTICSLPSNSDQINSGINLNESNNWV